MSDLDDAVRWCVKQSYSAMLQVIGDRAVKELADIRKGLKAWKEYANHLEHCVECFEMTPEYCEFGAPLKIDANKYGKEQK